MDGPCRPVKWSGAGPREPPMKARLAIAAVIVVAVLMGVFATLQQGEPVEWRWE